MLYKRTAISRRPEELAQAGAGGFVGGGTHDEAIDHPMMKDLKAVLRRERLRGYPTLEDIEDRTDLYDILNRISRRDEINELFEQLGQILKERVEALVVP